MTNSKKRPVTWGTRSALLTTVGLLAMAGCPGDDSPPSDPTEGGSSTGMATTTSDAPGSTGDPTTGGPASTSGADSTGSSEGGSSTGAGAGLPDIDMTVVLEDTQDSVYTDHQPFAKGSCEVVEGCVHGAGERRLLRFDTITPNLGDADFYVGTPDDNPELFDVGCTGQPVFTDYAAYRLLSADGMEVISEGHKAAFALIDVAPYYPDAGPPQYGFDGTMGISVGWIDIYGAGLPCQYVDITDVPIGDYQLEISINGSQGVEEITYDNNVLLVPVTITEEDTGGAPKGWNCNSSFYDGNDGCDCGCGLVDPDCMDMTVESCQYCDIGGTCSMVRGCGDIDPLDNSQCLPPM